MRELFVIYDKNGDASTEVITASSQKEVIVQLQRSPGNSVYRQYASDFELVKVGEINEHGYPEIVSVSASVPFTSVFLSNQQFAPKEGE